MKDGLIIDCFAGGGGASCGVEMALGKSPDIAVNHDPKAIAMHKANHPNTYHVTEDIFVADLKSLVAGRHVALMWASPDCTSHSRAKGGKPCKSGLRMLPWAVHKHARDLLPDVIIMENVVEIKKWGPLGEDDKPIKSQEGEEYAAFVAAMRHLGYTFESRELVASDYGAPTSRKRWYAILRRDGLRTVWPEPTHSNGLFGEPYRTTAECIDWSDLGASIFGRKRPLAEATKRRIARGIEKYVLSGNPRPFIVPIGYGERAGQKPRVNGVDEPLGTIVAGGTKHYLCQAFLTKFYGTSTGQGVAEPLSTVTSGGQHHGLVAAFLTKYYGSGTGQDVSTPLGTITTKDRFGLVCVEVGGETYHITDITLRMLKPREYMLCQGFRASYVIDRYFDGTKVPTTQQVKMIGNSVSPPVAEALVSANCKQIAAVRLTA